jgi:Tfp pilus assembly protein PilO
MNARLQQFLDFTRRYPVIVASLTVIVFMGSASSYLWHRQHGLTASHEELRRSGEDMLQALTGQARIAAETATVTEALDFIELNLINEADLAENLGYFYSIESAARLRFSQLNQLSSQPQPPGSLFKPVPFSLRATGTYRQILRLLHELETGPRLLRIRTYTLAQSEGGSAPVSREGATPGPGAAASELAGLAPDLVTMELSVELLARP